MDRRCWSLLLVVLSGVGCTPTDPAEVDPDPDPGPVPEVPFPIEEVPLTGYVDPFIGSQGSGNTIPGALVPHGMVRLSPDTVGETGDVDAYEYDSPEIEGFTHLHWEGPGGGLNGYSQLLVLPQTGPLDLDPETRPSAYQHATEEARPGYYAVTLDDHDVRAELTATSHAGVHRYGFPAGTGRLLLDLGHSLGLPGEASLSFDGQAWTGQATYVVHPVIAASTLSDGRNGFTTLYFHMALDRPADRVGSVDGFGTALPDVSSVDGEGVGGWVEFDLDAPTDIELRVGVSLISVEQARRNLETEVGERTFDEVAAEADAMWNRLLNRVQADGSDDVLTQFYTALYHASFQPADYTEASGQYVVSTSGAPVVQQSDGFRFFTDDWCMWDTFRTSHPLGTLVEPELRDDIIGSMLVMHEQGGWLPKCTYNATGYSRVMTGNPAVPIIADSAVKGLLRFDTDLAWEAVDHVGMDEIADLPDLICGYVNQGTPPDYLQLGYVPTECDTSQSAGMTLEHAYDDWAAGRFADVLGRTADAERYDARGQNWRQHFNPDHGFMQGRHRDGSWVEPFDPAYDGDINDFVEASSWIYTFFVPHDVPGLIEAIGGEQAFGERLDTFFAEGHYQASNQPSFHVPWLYAHAGNPAGTQAAVRTVLDTEYRSDPSGLPGNDDAGSTSAWLVLAMLGIYPVSPGDGVYTLTTPRLASATVHLHPGYYDGGTVELRTVGDPETEPYVASMTWNGEPLTEPFIDHATLVSGGVLEVVRSAVPTSWGE